MIGVVNYRAGNAPSVLHALERVGAPGRLVGKPDELAGLDAVILPGVGSAGATMRSLADAGLDQALNVAVHEKKLPFLGICVGLQVLFEYSEEEDTACLGWLRGTVRRFDPTQDRVPQMGWNDLRFLRRHPLAPADQTGGYVYFVNSYYALTADLADCLATASYAGVNFTAMVARGHIVASQFHMEKSGPFGLALLRRFVHFAVRQEDHPC